MAAPKTFRESCCEKLGIPKDGFEEAVLWRCLPPLHRPIGKLRWRFSRNYFDPDLELLRGVASAVNMSGVRAELAYHRSTNPNRGLQRGLLRARLSGQRLINLASKVLRDP